MLPEEPDQRRTSLALVWTAVLVAAVAGSQRPLRSLSLAGGVAVLAVAAQLAARVSDARAGGREAVRFVGFDD